MAIPKYNPGDQVILGRHVNSGKPGISGHSLTCWSEDAQGPHVGKQAVIHDCIGTDWHDGSGCQRYQVIIDGSLSDYWWREIALTPVVATTITSSTPATPITPLPNDLAFFASVGPGMCKCGIVKNQCDYHR